LEEFVALIASENEASPAAMRLIPLIGLAQAGRAGHFDDSGFPAGHGWEEIVFPELSDPHAYALEITGESMLPVYRDGDRIIVSPAASKRRGDRVVVKTVEGEVMAKILGRTTMRKTDLQSFNPISRTVRWRRVRSLSCIGSSGPVSKRKIRNRASLPIFAFR
jgi:phage repressor protein C with HTH and peptisase S24 domain